VEHRQLGKSGLEVGAVGLGTWRTFDVSPAEPEEMRTGADVVEAAIASGTNLFDSSPMYGRAEAVLGQLLGDRRQEVLVATKVWSPSVQTGREQIDRALKYYGGWVDLYQVHNLVNWEAYLPIFRDLEAEGRIKSIGVTHYAHSSFPALMRIMESEQIDTVQIPYNAADRLAAQDPLPLASETGTGVIVMSPLGTGSLVRASPPEPELKALAAFGVRTWAQALLKWILSDARVDVVIPATSNPGRARENAEAGKPPWFPEEERERVAWLADRITQ
jgi:aryl-alcohol dehydrogenase-like predicted oxidoreductase